MLLQVATYTHHIANMASSAATSKRLAIALETKVTEKNKTILSLEDVVKAKEEQLQLSLEKENQTSNKLRAAETRIIELEAALKKTTEEAAKFKTLVDEITEEARMLNDRVKYFESSEYTEKVIDLFQKSGEYQLEFFYKVISYYDRGAAHILRQVHKLIPDKHFLCKIFEGKFGDPEFRGGANVVPFSTEELKDIDVIDSSSSIKA